MSADVRNFALFRPAYQSSIYHGGVADKAVDGDAATYSHTIDGELNPWWKVKLAYPVRVTHIEISNRQGFGKYKNETQLFFLHDLLVILMMFW